jgi:hypothetical protein
LLFQKLAFTAAALTAFSACSLMATRPVQDMSDTAAAIRAAREVQADTLSPELFRQATEWFFRARKEYKFKNFDDAKEFALKARSFAEQAEFEAIRNGGNRTDISPPPPAAETKSAAPYPYPTPQGIPADQYDQRKAEEEAKKKAIPSPENKADGLQPRVVTPLGPAPYGTQGLAPGTPLTNPSPGP